MIDFNAINVLIIWKKINYENGTICLKQGRKFLISLGKELYRITKEAEPVAPISATRKKKIILSKNGALLNKSETKKCQFLCSKCTS